jgi:glycosyltransferase involved in cell wall biosynthesis
MYEGSTVGVVVPAYNEEENVGRVIETMPEFVDRIYAVDDGSEDGTWEEIRRRAGATIGSGSEPHNQERTDSPRIVAIRHETNRGVGAAVKTGYARALADQLDVTAVMDGDGQMDPADLSRMLTPVVEGEADYAKGTRLHRQRDRAEMSRWRLVGNWVLTMLTRASSGYWQMTDPQNGYRVISRQALATIPFESAYENHGFTNDVLALLNVHGFRIADVSHGAVYGDEESDIDYTSFVPGLSWLLLRRYLWRLKTSYLVRAFHPLVVCYPVGLGATLGGTASAVYAVSAFDGSGFLSGLAAVSVALLGVLLFVLALWFDVENSADLVINVDADGGRARVGRPDEASAPRAEIELASDGGRGVGGQGDGSDTEGGRSR